MTQQYNEQMVDLLQQGINYGLTKTDQIEFLANKSKSFSLNSAEERIEKYDISNTEVLGVRVVYNEKIGLSYTERINLESIKEIVDNANMLSPAYLIFDNYELILKWNRSLRFALAVCTLKNKFENEL